MAIHDDTLQRLETQLNNEGNWPKVYMFKFIILDNNRDYAILRHIFNEQSVFTSRNSSNGKYISITVKEMMMNAAEVMNRYRQAAQIEGIITL
jgi:putative lipoic acid-binding regulatory protein